jgi:hypothetical protein
MNRLIPRRTTFSLDFCQRMKRRRIPLMCHGFRRRRRDERCATAIATSHASSRGMRCIRREVRSVMTRPLPGTPIVRCVSCGGTRLIPLTFPGLRRRTQSERRARPSTKCVTCGSRYVGTQPLPTESASVSVAERDDANRSAPWGPALAEWALLMDRGRNRTGARPQNAADRTPQAQSLRQPVLQT